MMSSLKLKPISCRKCHKMPVIEEDSKKGHYILACKECDIETYHDQSLIAATLVWNIHNGKMTGEVVDTPN